MKKRHIYTFIVVAGTIIVYSSILSGNYWSQNSHKIIDARRAQLTRDLNVIQSIENFQSISNKGNGWYHINGSDANFESKIFYTPNADTGDGSSATYEQFLARTGLNLNQLGEVVSILKAHPYVYVISVEPNLSGKCNDTATNNSKSCVAAKIYTQQNWFTWIASKDGYLYVPFDENDQDKQYLKKYFVDVVPLETHWYAFSAEI